MTYYYPYFGLNQPLKNLGYFTTQPELSFHLYQSIMKKQLDLVQAREVVTDTVLGCIELWIFPYATTAALAVLFPGLEVCIKLVH